MYLDRAEDLLEFWHEADGDAPRAMSPAEIAAEFGGRVVGAPHGR